MLIKCGYLKLRFSNGELEKEQNDVEKVEKLRNNDIDKMTEQDSTMKLKLKLLESNSQNVF